MQIKTRKTPAVWIQLC